MKKIQCLSLPAFAFLAALAFLAAMPAATAWGQAMAHLGHVNDMWKDTPGQVGLVTILEQEANIAATHAGYANPCDAGAMKTHIGHRSPTPCRVLSLSKGGRFRGNLSRLS